MPAYDNHSAELAPKGRRGAGPEVLRAHNERVILGILHSAGAMSAAELSRRTGLSAQAVSVILRALEAERLILRGAPVRGRVGQPSVPILINPDGAFVLGAKIGRRSADLVLIGLDGQTREHRRLPYPWPDPVAIMDWLRQTSAELAATVPAVAGLGIALPFRLWEWADEVSDGHAAMQGWRSLDPVAALADLQWPVTVLNDGSAACAAEMTFGTLPHGDDVIYLFLGTFIGGGLAQRGRLVLGPRGNAGAFGSVLVQGPDGAPRQLIEVASLIGLERSRRAGAATPVLSDGSVWDVADPLLDQWLGTAASGIAQALVSAVATTDSRLAVIDGALPTPVLDALIARVAEHLQSLPRAGIDAPGLQRGTLGPLARAIGAAAVVLNERFIAWPADLTPATADDTAKEREPE